MHVASWELSAARSFFNCWNLSFRIQRGVDRYLPARVFHVSRNRRVSRRHCRSAMTHRKIPKQTSLFILCNKTIRTLSSLAYTTMWANICGTSSGSYVTVASHERKPTGAFRIKPSSFSNVLESNVIGIEWWLYWQKFRHKQIPSVFLCSHSHVIASSFPFTPPDACYWPENIHSLFSLSYNVIGLTYTVPVLAATRRQCPMERNRLVSCS